MHTTLLNCTWFHAYTPYYQQHRAQQSCGKGAYVAPAMSPQFSVSLVRRVNPQQRCTQQVPLPCQELLRPRCGKRWPAPQQQHDGCKQISSEKSHAALSDGTELKHLIRTAPVVNPAQVGERQLRTILHLDNQASEPMLQGISMWPR
jgi:hypothetical protein